MDQAKIEENVWLSALRLGLNDSYLSQALTIDSLDSRKVRNLAYTQTTRRNLFKQYSTNNCYVTA